MRCRGGCKGNLSGGHGNTGEDPRAGEDPKRIHGGAFCQRSLICSCCSHRLLGLLSSDSSSWSRLHPHAHLSISLGIFCSHLGTSVWVELSPAVDFIGCGLASHWLPAVRYFSVVQSAVAMVALTSLGLLPCLSHLYRGEPPIEGPHSGLASTPPSFQPVSRVPGPSSNTPTPFFLT